MRRRITRAFTLVELVIVIAIVGILAAIAIPRFIDIRSEAYIAQRNGIIGSVRAGILTVAAQNQVATSPSSNTFPPDLEATWAGITGGALSAAGTDCLTATPCFELVIRGGYIDSNWEQNNAAGTIYVFTAPVGTGTQTCTYSATNGTFTCS